jgi:hypothetical protein
MYRIVITDTNLFIYTVTTNIYTGWSESLCAPDDYNTERYK